MGSPRVSVIVPVYNGARHVADAIQSVLDQTFQDFELIVVNDGSTDDSGSAVRQFGDHRLRYIEHEQNRGSNRARNTGIRASSGEIIVLLDQDDIFHPEKLQTHVDFLANNPQVGLSYESRFELLHAYSAKSSVQPSKMVQDLWRPPRKVTLADMVLGFPFGPSQTVVKRDWLLGIGLFPEGQGHGFAGGEITLNSRLWHAGCQFASVDRALSYRRPHANKLANLAEWCQDEIRAQEKALSDPRCPEGLVALRDNAHFNIYASHACLALSQEETSLGQQFVREAARLDHAALEGWPCRLIELFTEYSIRNNDLDHESLLRSMFAQLPPEYAWLSEQCDWALQRGYVLKGTRAIIWGRPEEGRRHFNRAKSLTAEVDEPFLRWLTQKLLDYEVDFGAVATKRILRDLAPYLEALGGRRAVRWLDGCYSVNRAFESYRAGEYAAVPGHVLQAIADNPGHLTNRGVLSILLRSATGLGRKPKA